MQNTKFLNNRKYEESLNYEKCESQNKQQTQLWDDTVCHKNIKTKKRQHLKLQIHKRENAYKRKHIGHPIPQKKMKKCRMQGCKVFFGFLSMKKGIAKKL